MFQKQFFFVRNLIFLQIFLLKQKSNKNIETSSIGEHDDYDFMDMD